MDGKYNLSSQKEKKDDTCVDSNADKRFCIDLTLEIYMLHGKKKV